MYIPKTSYAKDNAIIFVSLPGKFYDFFVLYKFKIKLNDRIVFILQICVKKHADQIIQMKLTYMILRRYLLDI